MGNIKIPTPVNDPSKTFNRTNIVGHINRIRDKNGNVMEYFDTYEKVDGSGEYHMFAAEITAGDSKIRIKTFPSQKRPSYPKDLGDMVNDGDYVKIRGSLNENYDEERDRVYREVYVYDLRFADEKENSPIIASTIRGKISYVDFDMDEGLKLVLEVNSYEDRLDEYRLKGFGDNPYIQWLLEQNPQIGDVIQVGCYYINTIVEDEFGDIEDIKNFLEIKKIVHYNPVMNTSSASKKRGGF